MSDTGRLAHTPFIPQKPGRMSNAGIKNISCRESERNIDTLALPIDWKKFDITIWLPMKQNARHAMRRPFDAKSMSVASVVNRRTTGVGISCDITNPNDVTTVPAMIPYMRVRLTRAVWRAP